MSRTNKLIAGTLCVLLISALVYESVQHRPRWINTKQLGELRAFPAWLGQRGFIYVFSGAEGWTNADEEVARVFARRGNFVAGIDTPRFLSFLNRTRPDCVFLPGMLETYSHVQQRTTGTARFSGAVLLGHDVGATLVYIAQVQAPPLALRAVVGIDPEPQIALQPPLCDLTPSARDLTEQTVKPERLGQDPPVRLLEDSGATATERAFMAAVRQQGSNRQLSVDGLTVAPSSLYATYAAALNEIDADRARSSVADLPLVEVPAPRATSKTFAILYSGDGGWRDLDRTLADVLAAKGVNVVGVDVLRYYWKNKSPRVAAQDLTRIVRYYQSHWLRRKVLLIGFSFGANVLPFLVDRLPADVRADVSLVSLLSPERTTAFEVEPSGWFGTQSDATIPIEPALRQLSRVHVQCIYGEDEAGASLCTTPAAAPYEIVRKSGGHHFDRNYNELADDILAAAP